MQVGPEDLAIDPLSGVEQMMMVVPVNAEKNEAEDVSQEYRDERTKRLPVTAVGNPQLQDHDGDEDGDDAITEGFETIFLHYSFLNQTTRHSYTQAASRKVA